MKTDADATPELGILQRDREAVSEILNTLLADEYLLYTKTRNFHWNVTGPQFIQLHTLFESQYVQLNAVIDEVAERARALGYPALGGLRSFLGKTRLHDSQERGLKDAQMLAALLEDHESLVRTLRRDLAICMDKHHDAGTSDFLTGLMAAHEKTAWMLRAHLA